MKTIPQLVMERDEHIRQLWLTFRALSDTVQEMTDEDSLLWDTITRHSSIQSRLTKNPVVR